MFELFDPQVAVANIGPLLGGLLVTVELTFVVITLSLIFALIVALAGMSRIAPLRWLVKSYIEVIRGTPLLLQLIYVYYVLPSVGVRLDPFSAGVLALTLNYSAYISEVYRGAAGQIDQILRGTKSGEIPYQQATKFFFVINLKTAKALGLTVPPTLLARADEVIE